MNLPNKLTLTRILLVPVFMVFVSLTQIGTEDFNPAWYLVAGTTSSPASSSPRPASPTSSTAIWPASGTWSPTSASSPTRWPTSC